MRLKEFVTEGISDTLRGSMYRNLGIGGAEGNEIAAKQNFINKFKQQIKLNQKAGDKASGFDASDLQQMVDGYLSQYGWVANEKDRVAISKFIETGNIDGLANQMYLVGSKQMRDPRSGAAIDPSKLDSRKGSTGDQEPSDQPALSDTSRAIVTQLNKLSGSDSLDDLEQITKNAMQRLYKISPSSYQKLYKEIMTGKSSTPTTPSMNVQPPAKGSPEYFAAKRSLAAQKAQSTMTPK